MILEALAAPGGRLEWVYPTCADREREPEGWAFLAGDNRVMGSLREFWPQRGRAQTWDGVAVARGAACGELWGDTPEREPKPISLIVLDRGHYHRRPVSQKGDREVLPSCVTCAWFPRLLASPPKVRRKPGELFAPPETKLQQEQRS